jgi:cytochrome c biogenesis factor
MAVAPQKFKHMGFKTSAIIVAALMIFLWTFAFFLGQVLPTIMPGTDQSSVIVNWNFYFAGLIILVVMSVAIIVLHVLARLTHAGEQYIGAQ